MPKRTKADTRASAMPARTAPNSGRFVCGPHYYLVDRVSWMLQFYAKLSILPRDFQAHKKRHTWPAHASCGPCHTSKPSGLSPRLVVSAMPRPHGCWPRLEQCLQAARSVKMDKKEQAGKCSCQPVAGTSWRRFDIQSGSNVPRFVATRCWKRCSYRTTETAGGSRSLALGERTIVNCVCWDLDASSTAGVSLFNGRWMGPAAAASLGATDAPYACPLYKLAACNSLLTACGCSAPTHSCNAGPAGLASSHPSWRLPSCCWEKGLCRTRAPSAR